MKRILMSVLMIGAVGGVVALATGAFFSDTETSTDNFFQAGAIDLTVDNESYYNGFSETGNLVPWETATWGPTDIDGQVFFNFDDVKPGDLGEDTISLHVSNNPSWVCADIDITANDDVSSTEPELEVDDPEDAQNPFDGELAQNLNFIFWNDDGDNVLETDEQILTQGPASSVLNGVTWAIADSTTGTALQPNTPHYIGKAWCFGELTTTPADPGVNTPTQNPGVTCEGQGVGNIAQTDRLEGTVSFRAIQSRHNLNFVCERPTKVVTEQDLNGLGWFFYNDENDTIDNSLGSFVAGPATPPLGSGSVQIDVTGTQRRNLATYQFAGTPLADIDQLSYSTYQPSSNPGNTQYAAYLQFNVDFNGTDAWQKRISFIPRTNGTVNQDAWQNWDAINGGNALWEWSGFAANGNKWLDGNTNHNRTWNDLVSSFPNIRIRVSDPWLGMRVGEPYNSGFTGNIDRFVIGINGSTQTFDFEN